MIASTANVRLVMHAGRLGLDPRVDGWRTAMLDRLRDMFEEHGDPTRPWFAFGWAREHGLPVPEWVLAYLDDRRAKIGEAIASPLKGESEAEAVGRALGFRAAGPGVPSPGSQAASESKAWRLAYELELERGFAEERNEPFKLEAGLAAVAARNHVSVSTVRRAGSLHGEAVTRQVELIRQVFCQE